MKALRRIFSQSEHESGKIEPVPSKNGIESDMDEHGTNPLPLEGITRPLAGDDETPALIFAHLMYGQASDQGIVRKNNQDTAHSFLSTCASTDIRPDFGVFIVADGMGGHHDGEIASAIAARTVVNEIVRRVFLPMVSGSDEDRPPIAEALDAAIMKANAEVVRSVPDGGTTLTAAVIIGDLACIGHVGDSRAYLIDQRSAEQITRDHSYVQRLFELGQIDASDTSTHPIKNVLYRALGQTESLEVDISTRRLPAYSHLLICSDGLWGQVKDSEIVRIVNQHDNPQAACLDLIALANQRGGIDNVTAILIKVPG
jgi:serine/threonine protein phosphatase PrpC